MKDLLYAALDTLPNNDQFVVDTVYRRYVEEFDETFFEYASKELTKINSFFNEKLAEAIRKFNDLKNELNTIMPSNHEEAFNKHIMERASSLSVHTPNNNNYGTSPTTTNGSAVSPSDHHGSTSRLRLQVTDPSKKALHPSHNKVTSKQMKKIKDLKLAFSEFYLNCILVQNYQTLNFTGFRKIMKKHDKLLNTSSGNQWREKNVDSARFYTCKEVNSLIEEVENLFTNVLEEGNRSKAMKRLRVPPLNAHQSLWTTYRVGLFSGAFLILISIVMVVSKFENR